MLRRPLRRRAGFSLVEVLVALFIVSAGLIALLTLFPLGAYQMGQALRDDRSQQAALQCDGKVKELWRARVLDQNFNDPFYADMDDPDGAGAAYAPVPATSRRASYPVLLDPAGYASYPSKRTLVANGLFPRRTPSQFLPLNAATVAASYRYATMPDDMEFGPDGTPADRDGNSVIVSGQPIFRAGRYNYAAVIQRPDNSNRTVADLKILVFDRRAPGVDPIDNELAYVVNNVTPGQTQITLPASNDVLGLKVGSWIMDANFYRVTSLDADTVPTQVTVELHVPVVKTRGDAVPTAPYNATFYLFRELIDVYDRPQLAPSGYAKQSP
jgi:prepilin-type N-terminal cleavage/methylation domain-containing protein